MKRLVICFKKHALSSRTFWRPLIGFKPVTNGIKGINSVTEPKNLYSATNNSKLNTLQLFNVKTTFNRFFNDFISYKSGLVAPDCSGKILSGSWKKKLKCHNRFFSHLILEKSCYYVDDDDDYDVDIDDWST